MVLGHYHLEVLIVSSETTRPVQQVWERRVLDFQVTSASYSSYGQSCGPDGMYISIGRPLT